MPKKRKRTKTSLESIVEPTAEPKTNLETKAAEAKPPLEQTKVLDRERLIHIQEQYRNLIKARRTDAQNHQTFRSMRPILRSYTTTGEKTNVLNVFESQHSIAGHVELLDLYQRFFGYSHDEARALAVKRLQKDFFEDSVHVCDAWVPEESTPETASQNIERLHHCVMVPLDLALSLLLKHHIETNESKIDVRQFGVLSLAMQYMRHLNVKNHVDSPLFSLVSVPSKNANDNKLSSVYSYHYCAPPLFL